MTRTLVRPSLYDQDYLAWTEQQAALVRAGRLDQPDRDNLAEELDTRGRGEWSELENRLEVLLLHMLKWDHQPARRSRSWKATMREQRNAIRRRVDVGDRRLQPPYSVGEILEPATEVAAPPASRRPGRRR